MVGGSDMLPCPYLPPFTWSMHGVMPTLFRSFKNMELIETRFLSGGTEKQYGASSLVQFEYQVTTTCMCIADADSCFRNFQW